MGSREHPRISSCLASRKQFACRISESEWKEKECLKLVEVWKNCAPIGGYIASTRRGLSQPITTAPQESSSPRSRAVIINSTLLVISFRLPFISDLYLPRSTAPGAIYTRSQCQSIQMLQSYTDHSPLHRHEQKPNTLYIQALYWPHIDTWQDDKSKKEGSIRLAITQPRLPAQRREAVENN